MGSPPSAIFAQDTAMCHTTVVTNDTQTPPQDLIMRNMEFSPYKCHVVQVTGSLKPMETTNSLTGQVLEAVSSAKYLGVDISGSLSKNFHVDRVVENAYWSLGQNIYQKSTRKRNNTINVSLWLHRS